MTTGTSWRIQGNLVEACSCNVGCPCQFGSDPSKGYCEGILGFHIQDGNYGNTQLNDLNMVLILRSPGNLFKGGWTLGAYMDQRASSEQQQALGALLSGQAGGIFEALGGLIENPIPPKQVPINFHTMDGELSFSVEGLLEMNTERVPNPEPGQPPLDTKITEPVVPMFSGPLHVRRNSVLRLTDPNLSFDHSGQQAVTGNFDLSGP